MPTSATLAHQTAESIDEIADNFVELERRTCEAYRVANQLDDAYERCRFSLLGAMYRAAQPRPDGLLSLRGQRFEVTVQFGQGAHPTAILNVSRIA